MTKLNTANQLLRANTRGDADVRGTLRGLPAHHNIQEPPNPGSELPGAPVVFLIHPVTVLPSASLARLALWRSVFAVTHLVLDPVKAI